MRRKRVPNRLWRAYSGSRSRKFWNRVNALPWDASTRVYRIACELQELESKVLNTLKLAEQAVAKDGRGTEHGC